MDKSIFVGIIDNMNYDMGEVEVVSAFQNKEDAEKWKAEPLTKKELRKFGRYANKFIQEIPFVKGT